MYCTKCGKEIESGIICRECLEAEREQAVNEEPAAEQIEKEPETVETVELDETLWQPAYEALVVDAPIETVNENSMLGFGRALASTITGFVASMFGLVAYIFAIYGDSITESDPETALALLFAAVILTVVFTLPLGIISLVMGVKSIALFKRTIGKKPVATLILGIIGTYQAVSALLTFLSSLTYL